MTNVKTGHFTGQHMLALMVVFFAVVLTANMSLVYFSSHSWTGLVVENAYVASQEFDATTRKLELAARGIHATESYANNRLIVTLHDPEGNAIMASHLTVALGRPSDNGEDQTITLREQSPGIFTADLNLAKGQWSGIITGTIPQHDNWQRAFRFVVTETRS